MRLRTYLDIQALIFFIVAGLLWFLPWRHLGGVDWAWTLAYGSLLALPLWLCRANLKALTPVFFVGFVWLIGRYVALELPGYEVLATTEADLYTICFLVCATCWRGWMAFWCVPVMLYTVRLTGMDAPTYAQLGFHNLLFACLALTAGRRIETTRQGGTVKEIPISTEYEREAA